MGVALQGNFRACLHPSFALWPELTGHYGIVSLGVLRHNGQRVAVKRIKKAAYTDQTALQAEVAILRVRGRPCRSKALPAALNVVPSSSFQEVKHPNIIRLLDAFETRETLTLVCADKQTFSRAQHTCTTRLALLSHR